MGGGLFSTKPSCFLSMAKSLKTPMAPLVGGVGLEWHTPLD